MSELDYLSNDWWVKFGDGDQIIQGYRPPGCAYILSVEQAPLRRVYTTDIFELWHKAGQKVWVDRSQGSVYEPAAFIVVWDTCQTLEGYRCYSVSRVVRSERKYQLRMKELIQYVNLRYRGE